ncbi:hypothetical protein C7271_10615 [filamentous cyanobacterium CCP5]|nr:hypothetical protein C7271_10615 [filamentous cyanobacterium CCP5]
MAPSSVKKLPLRMTFIVPFVLQIIAAVGLTGWLSFRNGQRAVNDLSKQLRAETTARVEQQLDQYLRTPHLINQINADDLRIGKLSLEDIPQLERHFWQQIQRFPSASYIYMGTPSEIFSGAEQVPEKLPNVAYWTGESPQGIFETYATDDQGYRRELVSEVEGYDLLGRPWYQAAAQSGAPVWGNIYVWSAPYPNVALPAVQPIYDNNGTLAAVFSVDISLLAINDFLKTLEVGETGEVVILERDGLVVSSSTEDPPFLEVEGEQQRLQAAQSESSLIQGTAQFLSQNYESLEAIDQPQQLSFELNGERQLLQLTPYQDEYGLDWLIAVVIPEADFMQQIHANTRNTLLLCVGALGTAIVVGILTTRWITRPLKQISEASNQLAQGNLNQQVAPSNIREINTLGKSFNSMAGQLRQSFSALRQSEERFRGLVDNVPGAIYRYCCEGDGMMDYISDAMQDISGYPAREFIHNQVRSYSSIVHPEDRDMVKVVVERGIVNREAFVLDYRIQHRDGRIRWVYEKGQAVFQTDGQTPLFIDGAIFDITERKEAEEALRQSEATNSALVYAIPDLLLRVRRDGSYVGEAIGTHRFKLTPGAKSVREALPLALAEQQMFAIEKTLHTGDLQMYEHRLLVDGEAVDQEVRVVSIGADEVLVMVRDISDRKRAEEALRITEENYRSIFENALEGIFQSSPDGYFINVNPALARIYGYDSPEEMLQSVTNIGEQLYVDSDRRAEFRRLIETQGTVKDFEYRCYCKDGSIIWTQIDARVVTDSTGKVLYYEGIVQDITDRKRREADLKRQLEDLRIEIDEKKRKEEVATLTASGYFQEVQQEIAEVDLDKFWS